VVVFLAACGGVRDPVECTFGQSSEACEPVGPGPSKAERREAEARRVQAEGECRQGNAVACRQAGEGASIEKALPLYEESCRLGHGPGCAAMGRATHGNEHRVGALRPRVLAALKRGCYELSDAPTCRETFEYLKRQPSPGDDALIAPAVARACELAPTDRGICFEAGQRYWSGVGVPADHERGRAFLKQACQGDGSPDYQGEKACTALGRIEIGQPP
jgi:TPR repeat protein